MNAKAYERYQGVDSQELLELCLPGGHDNRTNPFARQIIEAYQ
jgi:hypothetical protein